MEKLVFFTQAEIIYFKQPFPLDIVEPEKKEKKITSVLSSQQLHRTGTPPHSNCK
jgi:hypothetical protein